MGGMAGMSGTTGSRGTAGLPGMGPRPPIDVHTILTRWQVSPFSIAVALALVAILVWYLYAVREVEGRGRHWPVSRTICFTFGLLAVELALGSSVAVLAGYTFTAHIVQHLFLMIIAPPLLALGAPMTLLLQTSSRSFKVRVLRGLHSRWFGVLSHPLPVFFLYYLSMYAFFLTAAIGFAMDHMWLMDLINLGFLIGATLFWWPMVGLDPILQWKQSPGFKLINLLIGIPVESFLGLALLMMSRPAASMYSLASTHSGGGVLWAASEVATIVALAPVFAQWAAADQRAGQRIDARLDAGEAIEAPVMEGHGLAASFRSLRR
jgi:putative membrane protein